MDAENKSAKYAEDAKVETKTVKNPADANEIRAAYRAAYWVALIAGGFSALVCVALFVNSMRLAASPPLSSEAMQRMIIELRQRPGDDVLRSEIRAFDLLARKAFFTSVSLTHLGAFLLAGGILATLIALKTMSALSRRLPDPRLYPPLGGGAENAAVARRFVAGSCVVLLLAAAILGLIFRSDLSDPSDRSDRTDRTEVEAAGLATAKGGKDSFSALDAETAKNWPCFRGPGGIGTAYYTNAPVEWDGQTGKNILWKVAAPRPGFNSPVGWRDKIFIAGADKEVREVYCFDAAGGALLWRREVRDIPGSPAVAPEVATDTGFAASTAAVNGKSVFAIFANGDLVCLNHDGIVAWARNLGAPENRFGHASSLLLCGGALIVQYDSDKGGRLLGLDVATGKTLWDTPRKVEACWSSPILVNNGTRMEIIINANPFAAGYDPATGAELWALECMSGDVAPSPGYAGGMAFVANEFARLVAIRLGLKPEKAWEAEEGLPSVASPLATPEYVFLASGGALTCYDARQGKLLWKEDCEEGFYSSPILVGDRVYAMNTAGVMYIFKADDEYALIGKPELGEKCATTPAFLDGRIYIRGERNLFCVGEK